MSDYLTKGHFPIPVDPAAVAADWQARGYSCHDFRDPPGQEWNDFVHRTQELVTIVEGRLEIEIDGEALTAGPGDEIFIPKGAVHSVRNIHSGRTHWLFGYD